MSNFNAPSKRKREKRGEKRGEKRVFCSWELAFHVYVGSRQTGKERTWVNPNCLSKH
jgi:hypothetical protein